MALNRIFVEPMTGIEPAYSAWEAHQATVGRSLVTTVGRSHSIKRESRATNTDFADYHTQS
jgi:hypothetical protein